MRKLCLCTSVLVVVLSFTLQVEAQTSYPQFVNTGNPSIDSANYAAALQAYDQQKQQALSVAARGSVGNAGLLSQPGGTKKQKIKSAGTAATNVYARSASQSCLIPTDATWSSLAGNDDGSTGAINLGFSFDLYGTTYNQVYINNNGNITFGSSYFGYVPSGFPLASRPMIAGFWDDIDTRTCGRVRWKLFGTRLVVSYEVVGQYSVNCSLLNTFQIVIGTNNDPFIGFGQNVKLLYGDMQWSKGSSTVGINAGNGSDYVQVGRFGIQGSSAYDGGGGAIDGVDYLDYQCFSFNASSAGNQPPSLSGFPTGNTVTLGCGESATYTIQSLPPEVNQSVTTTVNTNGMCGVTTSISNGSVSTVNITVTGLTCNAGTNVINFTATDNGNPALSTDATLTVIVGFATPTITASGPTTICGSGSVTLTSSNGGSYQWQNNGVNIPGANGQSYTANASGSYTVMVTNGSCTVSSAATVVTVNPIPVVTVSASGPTSFCPSGSVTLTASGADSYSWNTGQTTASITVNQTNSYTVTGSSNGCAATPVTTSVTVQDNVSPTITLNSANGALTSLGTVSTYPTSGLNSYSGGLAHAHGIAYDLQRNTVFVTDQDLGNDVVEFQATQPNGTTLTPLSRFHPALTSTIEGIAFDAADNTLWICDFAGYVGHFDRSGNALPGAFNVSGTIPSGTFGARALGIGLEGNYIWIDNGQRAYRFNKSGGSYTGFSFPTGAPGITFDPERHVLWTSGWNDGRYRAYDPSTGSLVFTSNVISISQGHDLSIGAGRIWVASENSYRDPIYSIDIVGGAIDQIIECHSAYTDPGYTATDNCGTPSVTVSGAVNANVTGAYTLTYTATDASGNSASVTRTVTVLDRTAPVPVQSSLPTITGSCSASVTAPTANDACMGTITATTTDPLTYNAQGNYTVHWTYNDGNGNTVTQNQSVVVKDLTPPVIACPFNVTVSTDPGQCGANVTYNQPSATDNCGSGTLPTALSGYTYKGTFDGHTYFLSNTATTPEAAHAAAIALGGHLVTINSAAENAFVSGMSSQFIWIGFTDRDVEGTYRWITNEPIVYTNWNSGEPNNAGGNEDWAVINWGPNGTWNDWFYTSSALYAIEFEGGTIPTTLVSGPVSGGFFPVGTTAVTYKATDAGGNTTTCSFTVTVTDNQNPTITAPANINATTNTGCSATGLNLGVPVTGDNCGVASVSNNAPAVFPLGNTTVTWTVTDIHGRSSSATQTVTVADNQPPVLSGVPAAHITVNCDAVPSPASVSATDNCTSFMPVNFFQVPSVSVNTSHHWTADGNMNDLNGTANGSAVGVVSYGPGILGSNAFEFTGNGYINAGTQGSVSGTGDFAVGAWIRTTSNNGMTIIQQRDNSVDGQYILKIGTNHNASDNRPGKVYFLVGGASSYAEIFSTTTVNDGKWHHVMGERQGTTIRIYIDGVLNTSAGMSAVSNMNADGQIRTTIGADIRNIQFNIDPNYFIGSIDHVKVWTRSACPQAYERDRYWSATDQAGNMTVAVQTLHVVDITAPVISCPADITVSAAAGECGAAVSFAATATDNCGTATITYNHLPGSFFPVGTTTVKVKAVDQCGNQSVCSFTVTVMDNENPTISAPAAVNTTNDAGNCSATVQSLGAPVTGDNCGVASVTNDHSSAVYPVGTTVVTWTVTDIHGNTSTATQQVIVTDDENPTITAPATVTVNNDAGNCSATVQSLGAPVTGDNCGVASVTNDHSSAVYPVGTTLVTWTVTDIHGNTSTATQQVIVTDNENPSITAPATVSVNNDPGVCSATVAGLGSPVTGDNCGVASVTNDHPSAVYPVGTTVVTWTVTDIHGNSSTATQNVVVTDNEQPVFTRPADITIYTDASCGYNASVSVTGDVTDEHDNCSTGIQAVYTDVVTDGPCQGSHVITRTWHLSDTHGNAAADQVQIITVTDNTAPSFTRPADITIYTDANCAYDASVTATGDVTDEQDNCSTGIQASFTDAIANGDCEGSHIITRTWHLTDHCGNAAADQVQIITVKDITAPVVTSVTETVFHCYDDNNGVANHYAVPAVTATDNCTAVSYSYIISGATVRSGNGNDASGLFNPGTSTIAWTMHDACGNTSTATTVVTVNPEITGSFSSFTVLPNGYVQPNTLYFGYTPAASATISFTAAGGTAGYSYSWRIKQGNAATFTVNANPASIQVIASGSGTVVFEVKVTDSKGCTAVFEKTINVIDVRCGNRNEKVLVCHKTSSATNPWVQICIAAPAVATHLANGSMLGSCATVIAKGTTPEPAPARVAAIRSYPNPTTGVFELQLQNYSVGKVEIQVIDNYGKLVAKQNLLVSAQTENITMDITQHASGIYHLRVVSAEGVKTLKVVVAR
ncbi:MAG TPA: HYR domain-containing protein [Chitinophagaceae bacterium]